MTIGKICTQIQSDLTVAPLTTAQRATAGYVFCPDGMVAVGEKFISTERVGLFCQTPPLLTDTAVESRYVGMNQSPTIITRTTQTFTFSSMCNTGDIMVGFWYFSNLWLDQHAARCVPWAKYSISYNSNGASVAAPVTSTQTIAQQPLTVSDYTGTRTGYHFGGWNTLATGLGASYAVSFRSVPAANLTLYAKWMSTISYDANGAASGTVPASTTAYSAGAVVTLATNTGTLDRPGYTFAGWNTAANGSGTNYSTSNTTAGDITLYAQWSYKSCTPTAGFSNCALFPMAQVNLPFALPNTVPVGTLLQVEVWGAGGGVNGSGSFGGGAGGYSKVQIPVRTFGETFTIVTGEAGARMDYVGTYGGGGRTGTSSNYPGASGGGMSGVFQGNGLNIPLVISGGGGGASPGSAAFGVAGGGGGGAGHPGNGLGTVADYTYNGAPGTLIAGGAAASSTSPCDGFNATAGSKYQGGQGGGNASLTETGGGGGGGYFGGGGGRCQVTSGPVQNGSGGGGSGYFDSARVTVLSAEDGYNSIAGQATTGGMTSGQYLTGVGLGGGINNTGAAGNGLVVIQWNTATYTVTFDKGSGDAVTAIPVTQSVPGATVTIAGAGTATKTGFTFTGWNTLATGLGTSIAFGANYLPPSNPSVIIGAIYALAKSEDSNSWDKSKVRKYLYRALGIVVYITLIYTVKGTDVMAAIRSWLKG